MHKTKQMIGILGGTFDPIHIGHLRMALEIHEAFQLDFVHLIPCYQPVHRPSPIASAEKRFEMIKYAVKDEPALIADEREIKRANPSYTIDTLYEIQNEMPQAQLYLLLGRDAFLDFPNWHRFRDILNTAHLIIAHRPNFHIPTEGITAELLKENLGKKIWLQPITGLEISSSHLRSQIHQKKNIKYLLPDNVYQYIKQHEIY
jgi:nicotinate-nucleotide adenylyltransferase